MKKILVVLMAMLTMAVMLTGCGGDSKKSSLSCRRRYFRNYS